MKYKPNLLAMVCLAYRSDTFNPMSAEDIKKLERVELRNDCDLRTTVHLNGGKIWPKP
jgi:hypothetical protein